MTSSEAADAIHAAEQALKEARLSRQVAVTEARNAVTDAEASMDGSVESASRLSALRATLTEIEAWHEAQIAECKAKLQMARTVAGDAIQIAEIRATSEALLSRGKVVAEARRCIRAAVKASERILDSQQAWSVDPLPEHIAQSLSQLVSALPSEHPARVAYDVASGRVRPSRADPNKIRSYVAHVPPQSALSLLTAGLDDESGLAELKEAALILERASEVLAAAVETIEVLRLRRDQQREDAEDALRAQALQQIGAEDQARAEEIRRGFVSAEPDRYRLNSEGRMNPHVRDDLDRRVQSALVAERSTTTLGERLRSRIAELGGATGS